MEDLARAIRGRYARESGVSGGLGCGGALRLAALRPGEAVLEVGCGRGREALQAASLVGPQGRVVGIDLTPAMVAEARAAAARAGVSNVTFLEGSAERLPLADGSVDVAFSNCVLNHVPDKLAAYRELYRVLRPGGRLAVSDVVSRGRLPAEVTCDPRAWADCYGGAWPEEEYLALLPQAGFSRYTVAERREYEKNGFPLASLTILAQKEE